MPSRYTNSRLILNNSEYYAPLRESRGGIDIVQHATIKLRHPTDNERASTLTTTHVWKYGDRFYNLAQKYYKDPRYWWVIAWWNSYPTEASVRKGTKLLIPVNITDALRILEA